MATPTISRYKKIDHWSFSRVEKLKIPVDIQLFNYTVIDGDDWKTIAWIVLGNAQYYWVIAEINNVINPNDKLLGGERILVPDRRILERLDAN